MEFTGERMVPEQNRGQQIYLEHMARYLFASKYCHNKTVLDIACGSGYGASFLLENGARNVVGVDISEETIAYCKKTYPHKDLDFVVGDAAAIPLAHNSIDVVVSFETIEHLDEPTQQKFFAEIKRVLKPKGVLVISTPNSGMYPEGNEFHLHELTKEEFEHELRSHFSNIGIYYQSEEEGKELYVMAVCTNNSTIDDKEYGATFLIPPSIKKEFAQHEHEREELTQTLRERDMLLEIRNSELATSLQRVEEKEGEIRLKQEELSHLSGELQYKHHELRVAEQELQSKIHEIAFMKTSRFWKLKTFYEKFKFPLFRLVRVARKAFVVLRRDGPVLFAKKIYWKRYDLRNAIYSQFGIRQPSAAPVQNMMLSSSGRREFLAERFTSSYEKSSDYVPFKEYSYNFDDGDVKLIAFYLPQFHPIPENDENWGKGFTEWTNVTKAQPLFDGHYQPRLPGELGFYDLRLKEVMKEQIRVAKNYGIQGFCFHYYWFGGKSLLRTPLNHILENTDLDMPFCIHWANEPWTRTWDGDAQSKDILFHQQHSTEDDMAFIKNIAPALKDKRYIRINGRPLLALYRPVLFPRIQETIARWNEYCESEGIGKPYLVMLHTGFEGKIDPNTYGFDAAIEFPPHMLGVSDIKNELPLYVDNFEGSISSYEKVIEKSLDQKVPPYTWFRGIIPDWDNTARRKNSYLLVGSTPEKYEHWLRGLIGYTKQHLPSKERFIFVNAWNEWAEGAYLEPDRKYGYAYLDATRRALTSKTFSGPKKILCVGHDANQNGAQMILLNIVKELHERFHFDVEVLLLGGGPLEKEYQKYANVSILSDIKNKKEQRKIIKSFKNQGIMHVFTNTVVSGDIVPILHESGMNVVSLVHELPGIIKDGNLKQAASAIAQYSSKIVFPAAYVQKKYEESFPVDGNKAVVSPQGLYHRNVYRDRQEEARAELRTQLGLPLGASIVLGVGYADARKGLDLFVETAQKVSKKNVHFVWVGDIAPDMQHIAESARKKLPRVHFIPFVKDTSVYYAGADLYAMTSREDPFPSVVLESLSVGVPVVGFSDAGGFADVVTADTGVLVPYLDTDKMAKAIEKLLTHSKQKTALATAARMRIEQDFVFKDYVYELLSFLGLRYEKVSAIVTSYNYEQYLRQRLDTLVSQTYPLYEILVLDDASPDNSVSLIKDFQKESVFKDIELFENKKNAGSLFIQTVKGIELSRGDFVWVAESDDASEPEFLERVMTPFQDSRVVISYSQSKVIDEHGAITIPSYLHYTDDLDQEKWKYDHVTDGKRELEQSLAIKNIILNMSGMVFRKSAAGPDMLETLKTYKVVGDWFLYVSLLENGDIAFCKDALNLHRRHSSSNSSGKNKKTSAVHYQELEMIQDLVASKHDLSQNVKERALRFREEAKKHLGL